MLLVWAALLGISAAALRETVRPGGPTPSLPAAAPNADALARELPGQSKRVRGLDVTAHSRNFFDCVRTRKPTAANPDVMRRSHVACHAAALAWVLGRKLRLDPVKEEFVGDAEANRLRSRPERDWA